MSDFQSLAHSKWDCKYHIIFIPKLRKKTIYGKIRPRLKIIFHALAEQKGCKIIEGYLKYDHVHMLIQIPPKYKVAEVVGFLKGKSAIAVAREFGRARNFTGEHFSSQRLRCLYGRFRGRSNPKLHPRPRS
jgi:REP-associated tyrosine transposase